MTPGRRGLRRGRWIVLAAFLAAGLLTAFFATRFVVSTIYWSSHRDEPVEPWMTIGYVAHSYDVPPWILYEALDLPLGTTDRRTLAEIAAARGLTADALKGPLDAAIADARPPNPAPPPYPPSLDGAP